MAIIDSVSETLRTFLLRAYGSLALPPGFQVVISDLIGVTNSPSKVTLFLYDVLEDPAARNRPRVRGEVPPDLFLRKPAMTLLLRYLVTPWSDQRSTEQALLTRTLQSLYDGAIVHGTDLAGDLTGSDLALKLTLAQISLEDRSRIWHAVQEPYRLSVIYEVRVVNIPTETETQLVPVSRRTAHFGVPAI